MPRRILYGLFYALAAGLAAGCALVESEPIEPPVVNLRALEPLAMGLNSQVFRARLSLYNPNAVPLKVSKGELQLELAGVRAAKGRTLAPFDVAPGENTEVEIQITMNLLRDLPSLYRALSAGAAGEGLDYVLTGHVNVERRGFDRVPIKASGRLVVPAPAAGQPSENI
jgi:LEA14-like dessication related protein